MCLPHTVFSSSGKSHLVVCVFFCVYTVDAGLCLHVKSCSHACWYTCVCLHVSAVDHEIFMSVCLTLYFPTVHVAKVFIYFGVFLFFSTSFS